MAHSSGSRHPYPRSARVNQILREIISEELVRLSDIDERLGLLTVTGVDTTADLSQAMVFFDSLSAEASRRPGGTPRADSSVGERADTSEAHAAAGLHGRPRYRQRRGRRGDSAPPATMTTSNGLLLIDKPAGVTSHDVVAHVRKIVNEQRVGHAGTLDPMATGLLVLGVGPSTRLLRFAQSEVKRYVGTRDLGRRDRLTRRAGHGDRRPSPCPTLRRRW